MIQDANGRPCYADKSVTTFHGKSPSPELRALYAEMEQNPRFTVAREFNFYPRGFPTRSPGWGIGC